MISRSGLLGRNCVQVPSTETGQWFSNKGIYFPLVTRSTKGGSPKFMWHLCPWWSQGLRLLLKLLFPPSLEGEHLTSCFQNGSLWSGRRRNGEAIKVKSDKVSHFKEHSWRPQSYWLKRGHRSTLGCKGDTLCHKGGSLCHEGSWESLNWAQCLHKKGGFRWYEKKREWVLGSRQTAGWATQDSQEIIIVSL